MEASRNTSREKHSWSPDACHDLAVSMACHGQLVPVRVRRLPNDKWKLIYGFRRVTGAIINGWLEVEAVEDLGDGSYDAEQHLLEILHRRALSLWEKCVSLRDAYPDEENYSHDGIARRV